MSAWNSFTTLIIDWMGKAKYFIALSLSLLLIGGISMAAQGRLRYGIDFRGGTLVYVRFAQTRPWTKFAARSATKGLRGSTSSRSAIFPIPSSKNDVVIGLEKKGQGEQALDAGKAGHSRRIA